MRAPSLKYRYRIIRFFHSGNLGASVFTASPVHTRGALKIKGYLEKLDILFEFKEQWKIKAQHISHM